MSDAVNMSTLEIVVLFVFYEQQVAASAQCSVSSEQCSAQSASLRHGLTAHLPSAGINAADDLADADISSPADFSHQPQQHPLCYVNHTSISILIFTSSAFESLEPPPW